MRSHEIIIKEINENFDLLKALAKTESLEDEMNSNLKVIKESVDFIRTNRESEGLSANQVEILISKLKNLNIRKQISEVSDIFTDFNNEMKADLIGNKLKKLIEEIKQDSISNLSSVFIKESKEDVKKGCAPSGQLPALSVDQLSTAVTNALLQLEKLAKEEKIDTDSFSSEVKTAIEILKMLDESPDEPGVPIEGDDTAIKLMVNQFDELRDELKAVTEKMNNQFKTEKSEVMYLTSQINNLISLSFESKQKEYLSLSTSQKISPK
jgi:hypothetical protein